MSLCRSSVRWPITISFQLKKLRVTSSNIWKLSGMLTFADIVAHVQHAADGDDDGSMTANRRLSSRWNTSISSPTPADSRRSIFVRYDHHQVWTKVQLQNRTPRHILPPKIINALPPSEEWTSGCCNVFINTDNSKFWPHSGLEGVSSSFSGHHIAQLRLIFVPSHPEDPRYSPGTDLFLAYAQRFDIVPRCLQPAKDNRTRRVRIQVPESPIQDKQKMASEPPKSRRQKVYDFVEKPNWEESGDEPPKRPPRKQRIKREPPKYSIYASCV
ncbi:hypothetical protein BGY98DRAFT_1099274 [Russula aff. rugulosa BPL654]|nr:hypothetical protein BGY98DRAFT_1099274 [Russula aff. rugulosa BPL654]